MERFVSSTLAIDFTIYTPDHRAGRYLDSMLRCKSELSCCSTPATKHRTEAESLRPCSTPAHSLKMYNQTMNSISRPKRARRPLDSYLSEIHFSVPIYRDLLRCVLPCWLNNRLEMCEPACLRIGTIKILVSSGKLTAFKWLAQFVLPKTLYERTDLWAAEACDFVRPFKKGWQKEILFKLMRHDSRTLWIRWISWHIPYPYEM